MGKNGNSDRFHFGGLQNHCGQYCSHKIKTLALGRKAMRNLDSILKRRDITLTTKVCIVKVMVFPVLIYRCEIWTIKKAECLRIDAFKLWCWRRLFRVPCAAKRSNQCILKEINLEYSLEGWMLSWSSYTLATWCEESTHWKRPWCWERLRARGERGNTGWDDWIASLIKWTWVWANSRFVMNREAWCAAVHEVTKSQTGLRDWTTMTMYGCKSWTVQKAEWQRIDVF